MSNAANASSDNTTTDSENRVRVGTGKKLVFSAVMVVIALCSVEGIIRVTGVADDCAVPYSNRFRICDPILYFRNSPELQIHGKTVNREGFRTHAFTRKPDGVYRIVALGDSCTIGIFGNEKFVGYVKEPYPARLERMASRSLGRRRVEVFNLGVGGYTSFQGLMLLRSKVRELEPDLVTVRYGWNDHFMSALGRDTRAFQEPENAFALGLQDLLLRTKFYSFVRGLTLNARTSGHTGKKPSLPKEWIPNISIEQYKQNLRRIAEVARKLGAEVWFLTSPHAFMTDEYRGKYQEYAAHPKTRSALAFNGLTSYERFAEIHESYNEATRQVGGELGVPVIDMAAVYERHADEHLFSSADAMHPLQAGHDLEAKTLFEKLTTTGVVARAPVPASR